MTNPAPLHSPLPNLPWQDRPTGDFEPIWRYSENPIISRRPFPGADRIYNSAVVPWEGGFIGIFRVDGRNGLPFLHLGRSTDGFAWDIEHSPIPFHDASGAEVTSGYQYDPRVIPIDGDYLICWCNEFSGCPTIGIGRTRDFQNFEFVSNAFLPFNRNGVLFPKKFGDDYLMLSRPSDSGHTPFGDIYLSRSRDLVDWGRHEYVMGSKSSGWWDSTKIGGGPAPIETPAGWLLFYHAVTHQCNGYVYSVGAALLDRDNPSRVLKRGKGWIMNPEEPYECMGQTANVQFPCATLVDGDTGRICVYYGAADTCTALAFTTVDIMLEWLEQNAL